MSRLKVLLTGIRLTPRPEQLMQLYSTIFRLLGLDVSNTSWPTLPVPPHLLHVTHLNSLVNRVFHLTILFFSFPRVSTTVAGLVGNTGNASKQAGGEVLVLLKNGRALKCASTIRRKYRITKV